MGFGTLSDIVGVVVNVLHTDMIIKRLISVQPRDFETRNGIDKSNERFRVKVTLCIGSLFIVLSWSEVPCLISITTNNVHLLSQSGEIHASEFVARFAPLKTLVDVGDTN